MINIHHDEYLTYLGSFFAPASERGMWRAEYQSRVQRKNETVIPYLAAKWSLWQKLYGSAADDHFEEFEDSFQNSSSEVGQLKKTKNQFSPTLISSPFYH